MDDYLPLKEETKIPINFVSSVPNNRAKSRNDAAAQAKGNYLLFLDDDVIFKNWKMVDVVVRPHALDDPRESLRLLRGHQAYYTGRVSLSDNSAG